jgi:uncharacterized protein YndB with AHSA1/START domain
MPNTHAANELRLIRVYNASVSQVWEAWTDPSQISQWWGPRGFTLTHISKDLRVGGEWAYTMHGPDGVDYPNRTHYLDVEKHARLVYDHGANDKQPPMFRVTVHFKESDGKTTMDMTMAFPSAQAAQEAKKFIRLAGGETTWDRLAEFLAKKVFGKNLFVINRTFSAQIEQIFSIWTKPEHFSQWLAPTGFQMEFLEAEIKSGGSTFYSMGNGADLKMFGRAKYLEVKSPDRIVYTQQFCDEKGGISRHPMAPTWPETMLTTVTLASEAPDQTRVTIAWEPHGHVTSEELETFIQARAGMTQGWTGSFEKLDEYLLKLQG